MSDNYEKANEFQDPDVHSNAGSQSPLLDKETDIPLPKDSKKQPQEAKPQFREVKVGIWTLYYAIGQSWKDRLPALGSISQIVDIMKGMPIVWRFLLETLSLGPALFAVYFMTTTLTSVITSMKLYNELRILELIENPTDDHTVNRERFEYVVSRYLVVFMADWATKKINARNEPILEQRVTLYFKTRILSAQSRLDLPTYENPTIQAKLKRAEGYFSSAWSIIESISTILSIAIEISGQTSVMIQVIRSRRDSWLFFGICMARSLISQIVWGVHGSSFYARITDLRWLRMEALFDMGTSKIYKQDILGDNLEEYINSGKLCQICLDSKSLTIRSEYRKKTNEIGDTTGEKPEEQWSKAKLFGYKELDDVLQALPLIVFAWGSIQGSSGSGLSTLMLVQQATASLESTFSRVIYSGSNLMTLFTNTISLCEALDVKSTMPDGEVIYPEVQFADRKGMSIEFKSVCFSYPKKEEEVLKNMSFRIAPGQLCVIVGENGCGKSTTIALISRLYECTSGQILIDGRPLEEFKSSSVRAATCVMYQSYSEYPLSIGENILLGRPDSKNPREDIETAARMGGAYNFIQKLPQKFDTDLSYNFSSYSSRYYDSSEVNPYQSLVDSEYETKVSGGEWRRLALAKTYMRNSDRTRLLCYDEPSASLDPKAEFETFERIRSLQGQKTMIFVTHRFGHLTKHADLILYVHEGAILEQGTHKELLALDGEYAKMFNIQSQAYS